MIELGRVRRQIHWWTKCFRILFFLSIALLSISIFIALTTYLAGREDSKDWARERTQRIADSITKEIEMANYILDDIIRDMSYAFSKHILTEEYVIHILEKAEINYDGYFALGIALEPYMTKDNSRLFAPFKKQGLPGYDRIDKYYDYAARETVDHRSIQGESGNHCKENWYLEARNAKRGWLIPCHDAAIGEHTLRLIAPLMVDGQFRGVTFLDMSLYWLRLKVENQSLGRNGYAWIHSREGVLLYHGLKGLYEIVEGFSKEPSANDGQHDVKQVGINDLTGGRAWYQTEKLVQTGWTLHTIVNFSVDSRQGVDDSLSCTDQVTDTGILKEDILISKRLWIILIIGIIFVIIVYSSSRIFYLHKFSVQKLWFYSAKISSIFLIGTIALWFCEQKSPFEILEGSCAMSNLALVHSFEEDYIIKSMRKGIDLPIYIPTGLFIQSIKFHDSNDVALTGYVWQKYNLDISEEINAGIVFPEAIDSEFEEGRYRNSATWRGDEDDPDGVVLKRWYFKTTLRQRFDYRLFPFDRQSVWIRLWHKDFDRNVILVPDFESYDSLNPKALPGIEKDFVLSGWALSSSFYDIRVNQYNSNFGQANYITRNRIPELYFNVELRRRFASSFISYLFPLSIMLLMLYAILITTSRLETVKEIFGFNVTSVIASCSAIFFVVLVSHVQLRNYLSNDAIVYLEYFYLVTYLVILLVSINAILFSWHTDIAWISFRDNLIPKLLYWPLLLGLLFCFTAYFLGTA